MLHAYAARSDVAENLEKKFGVWSELIKQGLVTGTSGWMERSLSHVSATCIDHSSRSLRYIYPEPSRPRAVVTRACSRAPQRC